MHAVIQQGAVRWVIGCTVYSPLKKINKKENIFSKYYIKKNLIAKTDFLFS